MQRFSGCARNAAKGLTQHPNPNQYKEADSWNKTADPSKRQRIRQPAERGEASQKTGKPRLGQAENPGPTNIDTHLYEHPYQSTGRERSLGT